MLTREKYQELKKRALIYLKKASIAVTKQEIEALEVAEYNLGMPEKIGLELIVYVNTGRCCAKELILLPGQTCPEHRHPPVEGEPGKEETFRCRWGKVYLYVEGEGINKIKAVIPEGRELFFKCRRELILLPGDQYTIPPNTLHWFQAGKQGAVISEFSTRSRDNDDVYTDPSINAAEPRIA
jgi:D-lyxose ketol-isomerase